VLVPPLTLYPISFLLVVSAMLLLVTGEVARYTSGEKLSPKDVRKFRNVAVFLGAMFMVTVIITIINGI
jgi:hypothetical protein